MRNIENEVDKVLGKEKVMEKSPEDRIRLAHEIKSNPPEPGYMKTDVIPAIYSIDLNTDANWWFTHPCTVFPWLMDQGIRTHMDIKDSFKPEKRFPDFNYIWVVILLAGLFGLFLIANMVFGIF